MLGGVTNSGRSTGRNGLLAILAAVIVVTCVTGGATAGTDRSHALPALRVGSVLDIANLDLTRITAASGITSQFCDLAYGGLFHHRADGKIVPEIATSSRYVRTGTGRNKGFEFTLRRNVRFSDGTPFTAQTVVSWMDHFSKNSVSYGRYLGPNPRFKAVGRYKVRLLLTTPVPSLDKVLSDNGSNVWGCVPSPRALADPGSLSTRTAGAGPYMLDPSQTVKGDHYTFVPNPYYYDKKAIKFSSVYIKVISNASTMLQALQSGQLDVAQGDLTTAAAAESSRLGVARSLSQLTTLSLNPSVNPVLKDVRVRQALNYAIDRKSVARGLLGEYAKPTSVILSADATPALENYYPYNPARARSLLAAAGYSNGFDFKILTPNFIGIIGDPLVQAFAKYWEAVGIRVSIESVPSPVFFRDFGKYAGLSFGLTVNTTPRQYGVFLDPRSVFTLWGYDGEIHQKYWAGIKAKDPTPHWKAMWTRFTQQAYFVVFAGVSNFWYYSKTITGVPASVNVGRPATPLFTEWGHT